MKTFFKGFCIGLLSLSLLGLLWFLVLQPGLTNKEAQDLKEEYAQPLPGESSGRTYKGEHRTAGSIFFQWDCSPESRNLVVYGHNMSDGTMFAVLQKMADEAFRTEHSKILLQTSDGLWEYRIAAVLKTDITKLSFNRTEFADDADFLSFQKELFAQSLCKTETIPGADRRLLTLVTCSYEWESARTVVIATEVR